MKKLLYVLFMVLCCASLAGCGGKEDTQQKNIQGSDIKGQDSQQAQGTAEYTDILVDATTLFSTADVEGEERGMQYYQGEPVQIRVIDKVETLDIYLYKEGGDRELLLEGVSGGYVNYAWFLDKEKNFYCWATTNRKSGFVKIDASGKELYRIPMDDIGSGMIADVCQLADGRIIIEASNLGMAGYTLSEIDPATGKVSKNSAVKLDGFGYIAAGEEGLLYMDEKGVYEINMESGAKTNILSFLNTSYGLPETDIEDFRVLADGEVELLRSNNLSEGISEVLRMGAETTEKVVLTLRCYDFSDRAGYEMLPQGWMKTQIDLFNRQSDSYMIVLDENSEGTELEDFARLTSVELAAGKGPDIFYGDVLGEYIYGAIQKGALVDLAPYMENSGIKEEDYFPAAFSCFKENGGIYGVCVEMSLGSYRINQEVLGENGEPANAEELVDALLAWPEEAMFMNGYDSQGVLEYLLQGSENIWGMVDWETGVCDFSGELFAKILETAKRYGYDERKSYPIVAEIRAASLLAYDSAALRETEEKVVAGILFDDGCHALVENALPGYANEMLAINANSAHAEGAWEFISFLLGEEVQMTFDRDNANGYSAYIPVNKKAFEVCTEKRAAALIESKASSYAWFSYDESRGELVGMYRRTYQDITEEKLAEYKEFVENAKSLPIRTVPILNIIYEEAKYYFNGSKSIEDVSAIIRNRVQLYLDENN